MEERVRDNAEASTLPTANAQGRTESAAPPLIIGVLGNFDVLMGRGKNVQHHSGNERLRVIINIHKARYVATVCRSDKTAITQEIVRLIQTTGSPPGRFLECTEDPKVWSEVDDNRARVKVSMALRYKPKPGKRQQESSEASSGESSVAGDSDTVQSREESIHAQERPFAQHAEDVNGDLVSDAAILENLGYFGDLNRSTDSGDDE